MTARTAGARAAKSPKVCMGIRSVIEPMAARAAYGPLRYSIATDFWVAGLRERL